MADLGKYVIPIVIRKNPLVEDVITVSSEDKAKAFAKALKEATEKWTYMGMGDTNLDPTIDLNRVRVLKPSSTDFSLVDDNSFEAICNSTEIAGMMAEFKKMEKAIEKFEKAGNVLMYASLVNDYSKILWNCNEWSKQNRKYKDAEKSNKPEKEKAEIMSDAWKLMEDYEHECILLFFSMAKTVATTFIPGAGLIDMGFSIISKVYSAIGDAYLNKKEKAIKDQYDQDKEGLGTEDKYYDVEWNMLVAGIPMNDIIKMRKDSYYREHGPGGWNGVQFKSNYTTGVGKDGVKRPPVENKRVTVTFDPNGGDSSNPSSKTVIIHNGYCSLPDDVSRKYYTFYAWFDQAEGGTRIEPTTIVNNTSDHRLYAHWAYGRLPIMVFFDARGGTPEPEPITHSNNSSFYKLPTVLKTHYTFDGWWWYNPEKGKEEKIIEKLREYFFYKAREITVYAKWIADTVRVGFEAAGGTPVPSSRDVTFDSEYGTLPSVSKTGYDFVGWFTEAKGGTPVDASTKVANGDAHKLFAQWKAKIVKVSFDTDGGTPVPSPRDKTFDSEYGKLPSVYKLGYNPVVWFTQAKGGTIVGTSTKVADENDHTLYARWSPASGILVTFEPNGGDTPDPPFRNLSPGYKYGELPNCNRSGYSLVGWFNAATGGTKVDAKDVFTASIEKLYAHWTSTSAITVTFDAAGGTPIPYDKGIQTPGSPYGTLPTVAKDGYSFDGWFNAATGGTKIEESDIATYSLKLYAHWTANTLTVTFHRNGAESSNPPIPQIKAVYNSKVTLPTPPARPDYTFDGWNTKADGSGTAFDADTPVTANIDVYAKWKPLPSNSITITFNTNGGTPKPAPKIVPIGSDYGPLPAVTKAGCKFLGWANDLGDVNETTKMSFTSSHTLYAIWE